MIEQWEYPKRCLHCDDVEVKCPQLLCETCRGSPTAMKIRDYWYRDHDAGSVRAASGGLPSLGKRR
jgi:hypothetical protein